MKALLLISVSAVVGVYLLNYLRVNFDVHEKEPLSKMVLVALVGGVCSSALALFTYRVLAQRGIYDLENAFGAFFVIGPVEEFSKLAALFVCSFFIRKNLDEPTDGLIYMGCVAFGFSMIENFFYAFSSSDTLITMVLRLGIATPMHISFSIFMGLAFYSIIKFRSGWVLLLFSFSYAFLVHGLYDLVIFYNFLLIILLAIIKLAHLWTLELVGYTTAISPHRISLAEFIEHHSTAAVEPGLECLNCGDVGVKETIRQGQIMVQRCSHCSWFATSLDSLFYIFHRFGSTFQGLKGHFVPADGKARPWATLYRGNQVCEKKKVACFDLTELDGVLERLSRDVVEGMNKLVRSSLESESSLADIVSEGPELEPEELAAQKTRKIRPGMLSYLIYPFDGPHTIKTIYTPPGKGPFWSWGAFLVPEFWFFWNEILGAGFAFILFELLAIRVLADIFGFEGFCLAFLIVRVVAALNAQTIYFYRYGHWHGEETSEE